MRRFKCMISVALIICLSSCDQAAKDKDIAAARRYTAAWAKQGMWLPDENEIAFFREHLSNVDSVLREAFGDKNPDIRQRAAHVIGSIGSGAKSFADDIAKALDHENDRLVRIYFYNALSTIGDSSEAILKELHERFNQLNDTDDNKEQPWAYTSVDERICLAGALYELDDINGRNSEYLDVVVKWLEKPGQGIVGVDLERYWEHRWMAVNTLGNMPYAQTAIPQLERLKIESENRDWVQVHVPRVLAVLRGETAK